MAAFDLATEVSAFSKLHHTKTPCLVLISDPPITARSNIAEVLRVASGMAGCPSGGFNGIGNSDTSVSKEADRKDYNADAIVVHAKETDKAAIELTDNLGVLVSSIRRSEVMLPWFPEGVIWVQVGERAQWQRLKQ